MTSFPDPDRDGGYRFRAVNQLGQTAEFGIDPGGSGNPRTFIVVPTSLGFEFRLPNGQSMGIIGSDGRSTLIQVPQLQLIIPPNPPAPVVVDADPTKNVIAALCVSPITVNLPSVNSGIGSIYYILALDPINPIPVGAPLLFPLQVNSFGPNLEPVNLGPAPKFIPNNFQMAIFLGPGSGGWGAFTFPLLP